MKKYFRRWSVFKRKLNQEEDWYQETRENLKRRERRPQFEAENENKRKLQWKSRKGRNNCMAKSLRKLRETEVVKGEH